MAMSRLRRVTILVLLFTLTTVVLIVVGQFAVEKSGSQSRPPLAITAQPTYPPGTPIGPFSPLDPAIIPALQRGAGSKPLAVFPNIPPVGMYLPAGPLRSLLPSQTPVPTQTPSATATLHVITATPAPTDTPSLTPSITNTPTITPTPSTTPTAGPSPTFPPTPTVFATRTPIADL